VLSAARHEAAMLSPVSEGWKAVLVGYEGPEFVSLHTTPGGF
jgi:hypothetical protein